MDNKMKNIGLVIAGVIVGLLFSAMFSFGGGGIYSNVEKDFSEGISVDGTTVIDGSGNIDAPITSSTGTFSSTLGVSGVTTFAEAVTLSEAVACVNFNATSTATAGSLTFVTTGATSTHAGTVYWDYGACN